MIGVFDSGKGGLFALSELRRLSPTSDIAFFADTKNAPYGTKSREELIKIVSGAVDKLIDFGCNRILMACCTASTVYCDLQERYRRICIPIIAPSAKNALKISKNKRIGILSTAATKKSGAFVKAIRKYNADAFCVSVAAPELVTLAERGARDGKLSSEDKRVIENNVNCFKNSGIDTLILGCTHFAYFEGEINKILGVETVNTARVGAEEAVLAADAGEGKTVCL